MSKHSKNPATVKRRLRNIKPRDYGTEELVMHRLQTVRDGDPALSTCPLDILFARKLLTAPQNAAGWLYAGLHAKVYDKVFPAAGTFEMVSRGTLVSKYIEDVERDQQMERMLMDMNRLLLGLGWRHHRATHGTVVCRKWQPSWLGPLRQGLNSLARQFRLDDFAGNC